MIKYDANLQVKKFFHHLLTKQEAHGPHRSHEEPVQINIHLLKYSLSPLGEGVALHLNTRRCFVPSLIEIAPWLLKKGLLNSSMYTCTGIFAIT